MWRCCDVALVAEDAFMTIHDIYHQIFKIWRMQRMQKFLEILQPTREMRMLDVGGYPYCWTNHPPIVGSITCLNVHPVLWDSSQAPEHNIEVVVGDGCKLAFPDQSFDIVFSNSVIEHVGSWENQQAFAKECSRVGKMLWIQTPAYECPIEPHYLMLFIHWLPKSFRRKIVRHFTPWGLLQRPQPPQVEEMVEMTRLLTRKEYSSLFFDCPIYEERICGFWRKSYIAYRGK